MTPTAAALSVGVPNVLITFAYDYLSRRIGKTIVNRAVTPHSSEQISYLYDHWNPVAEWRRTSAAPALALTRTHLWGLDIGSSGKVEAGTPAAFQSAGLSAKAPATAGGVAGLIASTHHATGGTRTAQLPSYDANGNIIAWTTATGSLLRKIDYDAFGNEVIVENFAPAAETNNLPAFGFSTKPKDSETGLSYYGYRYYDPVTGRWPSRDPIEEVGGVNLYGFVGNDTIDDVDLNGLYTLRDAENNLRRKGINPAIPAMPPVFAGQYVIPAVPAQYSGQQVFDEWRKLEAINGHFQKPDFPFTLSK